MEPTKAKEALEICAFHILCDGHTLRTHSRIEIYDALKYAIKLIEREVAKDG